jgi:hypothetical protein
MDIQFQLEGVPDVAQLGNGILIAVAFSHRSRATENRRRLQRPQRDYK